MVSFAYFKGGIIGVMNRWINDRWLSIVIWLCVVVVLFWHPFTRMIMILILPLGSGIDDLIVVVGVVILAVLLIIKPFNKGDTK